MSSTGMLFANDHDAGRTFIFDLRDPLHPSLAHSFNDMAGFGHPHSYLRLPNGLVLAIFQHDHRQEGMGSDLTGGIVEINEDGKVIRASSNADSTFPGALLTPYSLVVLADLDRVVSTNSLMDPMQVFGGLTYQIWRLSDLKLLKTAYFDEGPLHMGHTSPEEPRRGPDGSIFVQTVACGVERVTGVDTPNPRSQLVYRFQVCTAVFQRSLGISSSKASLLSEASSCWTSTTRLPPKRSHISSLATLWFRTGPDGTQRHSASS